VLSNDGFGVVCNDSFFQQTTVIPDVGSFNLLPLQQCFNGFCNLVAPGGECASLNAFVDTEGSDECPNVAASVIQTNCDNGCFGRFLGPLQQVVPCVIGQFQVIVQQLAQIFCNGPMVPPEARDLCLQQFATIDVSEIAAGASDALGTAQIQAALDRLCYINPANGQVCYAVLASATGFQIPNPSNLLDTQNCPFFQSMGCCVTALAQMLHTFNGSVGNCGSSHVPYTAADLTAALGTCAVNTGHLIDIPSCPAPGQSVQIVRASWVLTGLSITAINALTPINKYLLFRALQADFSVNIQLGAAEFIFVTIGTITAAATGTDVVVTWTIRGSSNTATTAFGGKVTTFLGLHVVGDFSATVTFGTTPAGTGVVGVNGVGLASTGSTSTVETQTGASGVAGLTASMAVLLLAMLIALAMRF
jgi:hypothetical protein